MRRMLRDGDLWKDMWHDCTKAHQQLIWRLEPCVPHFCRENLKICYGAISSVCSQFIGVGGWASSAPPLTDGDIISKARHLPFLIIIITPTVGGYNRDLFIFHSASSTGSSGALWVSVQEMSLFNKKSWASRGFVTTLALPRHSHFFRFQERSLLV